MSWRRRVRRGWGGETTALTCAEILLVLCQPVIAALRPTGETTARQFVRHRRKCLTVDRDTGSCKLLAHNGLNQIHICSCEKNETISKFSQSRPENWCRERHPEPPLTEWEANSLPEPALVAAAGWKMQGSPASSP